MMLIAFVLLTGLALILVKLVRVKLMEGLYLAVSLIMSVYYLSGLLLKSFQPGYWLLLICGGVGCVWTIIGEIQRKRGLSSGQTSRRTSRQTSVQNNGVSGGQSSTQNKGTAKGQSSMQDKELSGIGFLTPAYGILVLVLLYGMTAFYGVFLQHIDELHLWGPVVRSMLQQDHLPDWSLYGGVQMYGVSFFQLFFLKLTGYSEQVMYAASFLMTWIGFLLPVTFMQKKDWKKAVLYSLILYFSFYSLYRYNYKSLYVDLPCAAWAGGLAAWWSLKKRRQRSEIVVLLTGLITICFIKTFVGFLMAALVILFLVFERIGASLENAELSAVRKSLKKFYIGIFLAALAVCLAYGGALLFLLRPASYSLFPARIQELMNATEASYGKAVQTFGALINAFLGSAVGPHSRLEIYPFAFLLLMVILLLIAGWCYRREAVNRIRCCYVVAASMLFLMFLGAAFIFLFSYGEAIEVAGVTRYFSILLIYLFLICLNLWMQGGDCIMEQSVKCSCITFAGSLLLLLFFVWGVNDRFFSDATAFNAYQIGGSTEIQEAGKESREIREIISDSDRVYFINQGTKNEFPQNVAYYYLESQVSNYLSEPWRFTEDGCEIRIQEYETPTIQDLPALLTQGGYTYLWVYDMDKYLAQSLETVFDTDLPADEMRDGQLFRVVYTDGTASGLKLESRLKDAVA